MDTPEPPTGSAITMSDAPALSSTELAASKKSYRRKYRKIMVNFEKVMQDSNSLFRDEQKILDISERLAEQNDQILQLLLDLNSMPQVPQRLRYDLDTKYTVQAKTETTYDQESGHKALRKARFQLQTGNMTPQDYERLKSEMLQSPAFAPAKSYTSLTKILPESTKSSHSSDSNDARSGFLSHSQEEQYKVSLDAFIRGDAPTPRSHAPGPFLTNGERNIEREKELILRNPVSHYNFLRKHHPQVFLQDEDSKPTKPASSRAAKRNTRDSTVKQEKELYDDDGIALDVPAARGKRKRFDEDSGYRPKGGATRKRVKRDSDAPPSRRKKSSIG